MESCSPSSRKTYLLSLGILTGMFFIFGAVSWVNSILIPYFRICCELTHFESYFVSFAFYIAYFIMAIPSGILLKRVGFKRGIMQGFLLTALGAFLFIPAALTRQFGIFLLGLFAIGTGLAILQTAANPYVTIIGPIDSAARRMSLMGIFNKTAGIVLIPRFITQKQALVICSCLGLALSLGVVLADFPVTLFGHRANASIFFLNALGFANALIYAGVWPLAIRGLGRFTKLGSSLLIMGLCGNAILPLVYGFIAERCGMRAGYWVLIPCFLYLIFFSLRGYKFERWPWQRKRHA